MPSKDFDEYVRELEALMTDEERAELDKAREDMRRKLHEDKDSDD